MTAEAVVMNTNGIAMAADSAISLREPERGDQERSGFKVFNTANKIFALSKQHPVGLMVYGDADFMGVPWEVLTKLFRREEGPAPSACLRDYASRFIDFLKQRTDLFPAPHQEGFVRERVRSYFRPLAKAIADAVRAELQLRADRGEQLDDVVIRECFTATAAEWVGKTYAEWRATPPNPSIPKSAVSRIRQRYRSVIADVRREVFGNLPLPPRALRQLTSIAVSVLTNPGGPMSGVVVAGYGEEEVFPHLRSFHLWGMAGDRLLFAASSNGNADIDFDTRAYICPFAQQEMVYLFMEGVDPDYQDHLETQLGDLLENVAEALVRADHKREDGEKNRLREALREVLGGELAKYKDGLKEYRATQQVKRVTEVVAGLPKDELAEMAEALVNLTSLKRKMSSEEETVGGPIDVAVISKGDGLVWVKRKHYFPAGLNPHYFAVQEQEGRDADQRMRTGASSFHA